MVVNSIGHCLQAVKCMKYNIMQLDDHRPHDNNMPSQLLKLTTWDMALFHLQKWNYYHLQHLQSSKMIKSRNNFQYAKDLL